MLTPLSVFVMLFGMAAAANDTVIIKYNDVGLSVNDTVDSATVFPPAPPGVSLVADLPYLGYQVFALDDPLQDPADYCQNLEDTDDAVQFCEPDSEVSLIEAAADPSATPDDPLFGQQYNIPAIDLPALWKEGVFGAANVSVCFPDTGSSPDHPELQGSIRNGTSFVAGTPSSQYTDGNGHGAALPLPQNLLLSFAVLQSLLLILVHALVP